MKKSGFGCLAALALVLLLLVATGAFFTVKEGEQVIVTQFGKLVREPITKPGLKFKIPSIQKVNYFDKRILEWDGRTTEMPTKDKTYIIVDTYARWTIVDPMTYFEKLRDEISAQSRLDDILGSETRNTVAKHELIEIIRTTKERNVQVDKDLAEADKTGTIGKLIPIKKGRVLLEKEIYDTAKTKLSEFGIELLDIRFKRINYNEGVQERIYERMVSERNQIAERFRSEGAGEAAKILGDMEKELRRIESEAYKVVETTKGEADALATEIYSNAFNISPEASDFYEFIRTMELYQSTLSGGTVVLSTDSDLFKYLKAVKPVGPSNSADVVLDEGKPKAKAKVISNLPLSAPASMPAPVSTPAPVAPASTPAPGQ
ncbi:MAG: protease modulator HflC [Verrucomicrobiales bacterium]|jgi:membrane protease subunit HflC|nr:protease modulator HflC [Verrucomicrobiales bacterium]MBP9223175.1 protease modulator HflC [Verrucomicrobiales bacterium]